MDHKTWLWRKRPSEKTIIVVDKVNNPPLMGNKEEPLGTDKELELKKSMKNLNDKLSSALSECNAKDDLVAKHAKVAEEALAGWEKADTEAASLKHRLDEALRQRIAAEDKINQLDAALKECTQQLHFVREEQEQRINDAIMKTSREHEKVKSVLEDKLTETGKRLVKLGVENTHLSKAIQAKEKLNEDLSAHISQAEADFNALMARLESTEKDNASLKYELRVLEKELEIRNEEKEFNRRSADASHRQHLESVKKIAKLESECQRLRVLVRKRLPGPAALSKMKNEVEMLGRESNETRRTKLHPPMGALMMNDSVQDSFLDSPTKRVNYLLGRLCAIEEENKNLKETLVEKNEELQSSRIMYEHTTSKLSEVEAQLAKLSKGQTTMELFGGNTISHGFNHDEDAEKWASALISELEHFRNEKPRGSLSCKTVGGSDMSLMDDFVEMEKLALVCVDDENCNIHRRNTFSDSLETELAAPSSEVTGKEIVPVLDGHSGVSDTSHELQTKDVSAGKYPSWLQDILKIILEQKRITLKSTEVIFEDIRTALTQINHFCPFEVTSSAKQSSLLKQSEPTQISGHISWGTPDASPKVDSYKGTPELDVLSEEVHIKPLQSSLSESICKIVKLIEEINKPYSIEYTGQQIVWENQRSSLPETNSEASGYTIRILRWKTSDLNAVLQQFVLACTDLLNGKANIEKFAQELTSAFDWIMNHCFMLQDVSSMRDTTKKHFDQDKSQSECKCGIGIGMNPSYKEAEKMHSLNKQMSFLPLSCSTNLAEENRKLKDELVKVESAKKDLEGNLQLTVDKVKALMSQLQESQNRVGNLQAEIETFKELNQMTEDQIETHKLLIEDLNTKLTVTRVELNEARQKFSSLEVELEDKSNSCQELEATCLELQLQLESVPKKEIPKYDRELEGRQLKTDWEIVAASEKLAECQETILNLGKQLKALAAPREAALLDKVISVNPSSDAPSNKKPRNHGSLLDQMLAEDGAEAGDLKSPKMKEIICTLDSQKPPTHHSHNSSAMDSLNGTGKSLEPFSPKVARYRSESATGGTLAIIPSKKRGLSGGLFRKLLLRKKRESKKMTPPVFAY